MQQHRRLMGIFGLTTLTLVGCSGEVEADDTYSDAAELRDKLHDEGFRCTGGEESGSDQISRLTCDEGHDLAVWDSEAIYSPSLTPERHHLSANSWYVSSDSADYVKSAGDVFGGTYIEQVPELEVEPSPEPGPTPEASSPEDEWLVEARDKHLFALSDWYKEYFAEDCTAAEPECYDLFAEGVPMMQDYGDWLRANYENEPDYVHYTYVADVGLTEAAMEDWEIACQADFSSCGDLATEAASGAYRVIIETSDWGE